MLSELQTLHQDAILWKSKRIWTFATNPDKEAEAAQRIIDLLLKMDNDVKRDRYIKMVASNINDFVSNQEGRVSDAETFLEATQTAYEQNKTDKNKKVVDEAMEALDSARNNVLPKIKESDLKSYVKESLKKLATKKKEATQRAKERKQKIDAEDIGLPENFQGDLNAALFYGLYEDDNQYYVKNSRDTWVQVSSFIMKVRYLIRESATTAYRIITMVNIYGHEQTVTFNTDDLTSVSSFKKVINRFSNYSFTGGDGELTKINEYLQKDERHATQLNVLGYNSRNRFWAWGNGIYDLSNEEPEFVPADDFGMVVTKQDKTFYIPAASKRQEFAADDNDDITPERKFVHSDIGVTFKKWSLLHYEVHGENSVLGQLWFCATVFRDLIFNNASIRRMPLLFLYGQPGTGKGVFASSLLSMHGAPQSAIMLESGGSTQKGILRRFAQFKNAIVWLDEYKNTIHKSLIGTIKQLYDGESYTRAVKSNDVRTESSPINCSAIVSGQDLPIIEAAVLERHILLQFEPKKRTETERTKYMQLTAMEAHGITSVTNEILNHRKDVSKQFMDKLQGALLKLRTQLIPLDVKERYIMNYGILMALYDVLNEHLDFPFDQKKVFELIIDAAYKQNSLTKDNNDVAKWWNTVAYLAADHQLAPDQDYKVKEGILYLHIQKIHPKYQKELRARGDNFGLEKSVLENYLKSDLTVYRGYKKARMDKSNCYVHMFDYKGLQERYLIDIVADTSQLDERPSMFEKPAKDEDLPF